MFDSQITEPIFSKYMHKKRACCMEKKKKTHTDASLVNLWEHIHTVHFFIILPLWARSGGRKRHYIPTSLYLV